MRVLFDGMTEPCSRCSRGTSYTTSRTWISPTLAETDRFQTVTASLSRLFIFSRELSPFCPQSLTEWIEHREAMARAQVTLTTRQVEAKQWYSQLIKEANPPLQKPFGGRIFFDNRTSVTAESTMWCARWDHLRTYEASWPSHPEMEYEGDGRAETAYGRFLPLPRLRPNPTAPVHDCRLSTALWYPFDKLQKILTEDDVFSRLFRIDEFLEVDIPDLLNISLIEAIDTIEIL